MPEVVDPSTFRSAVDELLKEEKQATRLLDSLSKKRRNLPAVKVDQAANFTFTTANGSTVSLPDLFEGREQLAIYQFMLYDDDKDGCTGCSFTMDHIPHLGHLHSRNTTFAAIAPAPIAKINAFRERMGWDFPFYSCKDTFAAAERDGTDVLWKDFAIAVFSKHNDEVLNTYGTNDRGVETLLSTYSLLDMTPLGRQEDKPGGIGDFKLHDQY